MREEIEKLRAKNETLERNNTAVNNDSLRRMGESLSLKSEIKKQKQHFNSLNYKSVKHSEEKHLFYTGIKGPVFQRLLEQMKDIKNNVRKDDLFCTLKVSFEYHLL